MYVVNITIMFFILLRESVLPDGGFITPIKVRISTTGSVTGPTVSEHRSVRSVTLRAGVASTVGPIVY